MHRRIFRGLSLPRLLFFVALSRCALPAPAPAQDQPADRLSPAAWCGFLADAFFPFALSTDTGPFQFRSRGVAVSESAVTAAVIVERIGEVSGGASVTVSTVTGGTARAGQDYTPESARLVFHPGQREAAFEFFVHANSRLDGSRTVQVLLSHPTDGAQLGSLTQATVTILDDEAEAAGVFALDATDYLARDGDRSVTVTVHRQGGSRGMATVDVQTIPATARAGFACGLEQRLVFVDGVTSQTVQVPLGDGASEEKDQLVLFNPTGGAGLMPEAQRGQLRLVADHRVGLGFKPEDLSAWAAPVVLLPLGLGVSDLPKDDLMVAQHDGRRASGPP